MDHSHTTIASVGALGAAIGVFQIMASGEKLTLARAFGRAGLTAALALSGLAMLTIFPNLGIEAKVGLAAMLASLGATGLERLAARLLGPKQDTPQ